VSRPILASACLGALAVVLLTVIGGAGFPNYSHASQFISELGADGAPHAGLINYGGFLPAGLLLCTFALLAWRALPRSVGTALGMVGIFLFGFGYLVAVVYPCEAGCRPAAPNLSQTIHNALGLAGYLVAPFALAVLGWKARSWPGAAVLSWMGIGGAILAFIGLSYLSPEFAYVGIAQRVLEASVLSWIVACGFYLDGRRARTAEAG
jgi:hypothetical membrane protein